jgi:hypothetical protein
MQQPQSGGMINPFHGLLDFIDSPYKVIYGFVLVLVIIYSAIVPSEYRVFADSLLGRIFGIAIVYGVTESLGWVYGLLTAMAFLLLLNGAPRKPSGSSVEGFDGTINTKKAIGKRWFVEKVLGERTNAIETDRVTTSAIESH